MCECISACVCACVCACVRARLRVCVRAVGRARAYVCVCVFLAGNKCSFQSVVFAVVDCLAVLVLNQP